MGPRTRISVVIPTYNRPRTLRLCLEALAAQSFPPGELEVLVVDDGGRGAAARLARTLRLPLRLAFLRLDVNQGPAAARNRGIREARGEVVAFLDDDCLPGRNWLRDIAAFFRSHPTAQVLLGGYDLSAAGNPVRRTYYEMSRLANETRVARRAGVGGEDLALFFGSGNAALRREFLRAWSPVFDESLRAMEDRDLYRRLRAGGVPIFFREDIRVTHLCRSDPLAFFRRFFGYGRGRARITDKWAGREFVDIPGPPAMSFRRLRTDYGLLDGGLMWGVRILQGACFRLGWLYERTQRRASER
jgi:glycosyltransferase involved in cell wall biosynthesis